MPLWLHQATHDAIGADELRAFRDHRRFYVSTSALDVNFLTDPRMIVWYGLFPPSRQFG